MFTIIHKVILPYVRQPGHQWNIFPHKFKTKIRNVDRAVKGLIYNWLLQSKWLFFFFFFLCFFLSTSHALVVCRDKKKVHRDERYLSSTFWSQDGSIALFQFICTGLNWNVLYCSFLWPSLHIYPNILSLININIRESLSWHIFVMNDSSALFNEVALLPFNRKKLWAGSCCQPFCRTNDQFRLINSSSKHVFGLLEEASASTGRTCILHTEWPQRF